MRNLNTENGEITDSDIYSLFRKQNFSGNEYLNSLQKGSNYFRFQYFNPLNASKYYENLDEQVLALITGEIGSMPDLKNLLIKRIQIIVPLKITAKIKSQPMMKNKRMTIK